MAEPIPFRDFCRTVCAQVRCRQARLELALELSDHLADHAQALMEAGAAESDAQARAVAAMGDPAELGRALDRLHSPWPWRIYRALAWVVGAGLVLTLLVAAEGALEGLYGPSDRIWRLSAPTLALSEGERELAAGPVAGRGRAGDYTFVPSGEALLTERDGRYHLSLVLASSSLYPYPSQLDPACCTAADELGNQYGWGEAGRWIDPEYVGSQAPYLTYHRLTLYGVDPDARTYTVTLDPPAGRMTFTVDLEGSEAP